MVWRTRVLVILFTVTELVIVDVHCGLIPQKLNNQKSTESTKVRLKRQFCTPNICSFAPAPVLGCSNSECEYVGGTQCWICRKPTTTTATLTTGLPGNTTDGNRGNATQEYDTQSITSSALPYISSASPKDNITDAEVLTTESSKASQTTENGDKDPLCENPNAVPCENGVCREFVRENGMRGRYCDCDEGWIGSLCTEPGCEHDCGFGSCFNDPRDGVSKCSCQSGYQPPYCNETIPEPNTAPNTEYREPAWVWYVVGGGIFFVILLLIVIVLLLYYFKRKGNITAIKMWYFLFTKYDDSDDREFDAFVSYRGGGPGGAMTDDEEFVYRRLFPKLEKEMNFKLCLHYRDFQPGLPIADNIIWAVENSRRTVLILSPEYCTSEWTRMEFLKAQHEMLKCKTRIIPIMFKDIKHVENLDPNLKGLCDTITYITWPDSDNEKKEEKFWTLLRVAMPKKHQRSPSGKENSAYKQDELTDFTSTSNTHVQDNQNHNTKIQNETSIFILDPTTSSPKPENGYTNHTFTSEKDSKPNGVLDETLENKKNKDIEHLNAQLQEVILTEL